jgi:hypothetical protein
MANEPTGRIGPERSPRPSVSALSCHVHRCVRLVKVNGRVMKPSDPKVGMVPISPGRPVVLVNRRSSWLGCATADRAYRTWGSPDPDESHVQLFRRVMSRPPLGFRARVSWLVEGVGDEGSRSMTIDRRRCRDDVNSSHDPHSFRHMTWSMVGAQTPGTTPGSVLATECAVCW